MVDARLKPEVYDRRAPDSEIDYDLDMSHTINRTGGKKKTNRKRKYKSKTRRFRH